MLESENFNKFVRLLARGGAMVLRQLLQKYSSPIKFSDYLYQNQNLVLKLKLNDKQLQLIAAKDISRMDITLLCKLVVGLFKDKITNTEKQFTQAIGAERDCFMHSEILESGRMSSEVFNNKWQEVSTLLKEVAKEVGDGALQSELDEFIENAKEISPDLADVYQILTDWCQSTYDLKEKIDRLIQSVDCLKVQQRIFERKAVTRLDTLKDKFQLHYDYHSKVQIHLSERVFVAREYLIDNFALMLFGRAGEGKTSTAFSLVKCLVDDHVISLERCALIFGPEDLNEINSSDVDLLFIDDIFGKHNTDKSKLVGWRQFFATLQAFAENKRLKMIFASRMHIYKECKRELDGFGIFCSAVELNSTHLSADEKKQILLSQLRANRRDFHDLDVERCISQAESDVGFPLCAQQFATDDMLFVQKEKFFAKPCKYYLEQNVRNLDDATFIALLYIFYNGNSLRSTDLDVLKIDQNAKETLLLIARLRGVEKPIVTLLKETRDKLNHLKDCYVKFVNRTYTLLHDTLYEIIAFIHAEDYSSEVVKKCTFDFLCQCVRLEQVGNVGEIIIDEDDFPFLAQRCIKEVIEYGNGRSLSKHPIFQNEEFVPVFLQEICKSKETVRDFFQSNVSFIYAGNHSFLHHILTTECTNDIFLKYALPLLECDHISSSDDSCWMCPVKSEALAGSSFINRPDIYTQLKRAGAKVSVICLHRAVENENIDPDFVKTIVNDLKEENKFMDNQYLQYVLGLSIQHNNRDAFKILTNAGLHPGIDFLYYAVKVYDEELVLATLKDLKDQSKLILDHMSVSRAVMESLVTDGNKTHDILRQTGAKLTDFAVYWAIVDHGYNEVVKVIQILKDNDTFDIESYGMAHGMVMAMKTLKQDDRIYKFLKSEGVIPTATLVGAMAEIGLPVCEIAEVVGVLKQAGSWTGEIEERGRATAYMAASKRNDKLLLDLLCNEGVTISPGCLSYAVVRNIDKVDHVIKSLKKTGQFNSDKRNIARAFVWSIEYRDDRIYNQLVKEGICFSMACLVAAVDDFFSLATLEIVISGLKQNKRWHPTHDLALEALNLSNKRQDKAAYTKLVAEGVQWSPRNLLVAVKFETVHGLRKVILQLNEKGLLYPKNDDIGAAISLSESLTDKRKQQLLSQHGLSR